MRIWDLRDSNRVIATAVPIRTNGHTRDAKGSEGEDETLNPEDVSLMDERSKASWDARLSSILHPSECWTWDYRPGGGGNEEFNGFVPMTGEIRVDSIDYDESAVPENSVEDTTFKPGPLDVSGQVLGVSSFPTSDQAAIRLEPDPSEPSSSSCPKQSRSSSMSLDSSQRPTRALSISDRSSWRFSKVTGLPSEPSRSDTSFRRSLIKVVEPPTASDARFYLRVPAKKFFKVGRVFAISRLNAKLCPVEGGGLHVSPINARDGSSMNFHICMLVVVQAAPMFCLCVPITTYGGRGLSRQHLTPEEINAHAIIFMNVPEADPQYLLNEARSIKRPIAVKRAAHDQALHPASRINFAKVHKIFHETNVMNVGKVEEKWIPYLSQYFRMHNQRP
jgi:hypothetical protein